MTMFWLLLTVLLVAAFLIALSRRRRYESVEDEPWRASLDEDEPLDLDEARRAEEEWLADQLDEDEDEPWRG